MRPQDKHMMLTQASGGEANELPGCLVGRRKLEETSGQGDVQQTFSKLPKHPPNTTSVCPNASCAAVAIPDPVR